MTENLLPDRLTPIATSDLYRALAGAWLDLVGSAPSRASLLVLLAQWAEETGRGKYCHAYNLGNIKHVSGDGHDYVQFRCNEIIGGKEVWIDPPNPGCSFRAYATLEDGARDYLALLRHRFAVAWPAVLAGDPAAFAHELKVSGYYTADEAIYTRALSALYAELAKAIPTEQEAIDQDWVAEGQGSVPLTGNDDDPQPTPPGDDPPAAA